MSGISSTSALNLPPVKSIPVSTNVDVDPNGANLVESSGGSVVSKTTIGLTDVLNISGDSGVLEFLSISATTGVTLTASELKITRDGIVIYDRTGAITGGGAAIPVGTASATGGIQGIAFGNLVWNDSILVEYASDGTNTAFAVERHYLTQV